MSTHASRECYKKPPLFADWNTLLQQIRLTSSLHKSFIHSTTSLICTKHIISGTPFQHHYSTKPKLGIPTCRRLEDQNAAVTHFLARVPRPVALEPQALILVTNVTYHQGPTLSVDVNRRLARRPPAVATTRRLRTMQVIVAAALQ